MTNIVLITRDRYTLLGQTLDSLYSNTKREDFNLTIVDDGSMDFRCIKLLGEYSRKSNCTLIRLMNGNHVLSQAKNIGVAVSEQVFGQGNYLYLSDNDVFFTPSWLTKLDEFAASSFWRGFRLWGGQVHPFHKPTSFRSEQMMLDDAQPLDSYDVLDGPSWLMYPSTWDDCGPFPHITAPGPCQSEEYPFCTRLRNMGHRIGVIQPHVVIHTGLTNSDGKPAPGADVRAANRVPGVLYE